MTMEILVSLWGPPTCQTLTIIWLQPIRLFWGISLIFLTPHFPWLSASSKDCRLASGLFWHDKRGKNDSYISQWRSWLSQRDSVTHLKHKAGKTHFWIKSWCVFWSKHVFICVFYMAYIVCRFDESTQSRCASFNNSEEINLWCETRHTALTSAQPARVALRGPLMLHVTEAVSVQGASDK